MSNNLKKNLKTNFTLVITALIVGIITSVVAQIFTLTAKSIFSLIQSNQSYNLLTISFYNFDVNVLPFFACIIAAIFIGILIKYQKIDRWHGPADTIYAAHQEAGALDVKRGFTSTIAAFFSISGGASVGIYGPLVHFGGTLGAFLRRRSFISNIPHDIIIGAGVAAAISAGFSSPIAGIIFAHEVILRHFSMRALTAISLSSVMASFTSIKMNLVSPVLRIDQNAFDFISAIPGLVLVGIIASIIAFIFMKSLLFSSKIANQIKIDFCYKPLFPAFLCGIVGIFLPEAIGLGSETILNVITFEKTLLFLLLVLIFKIILSSLCIGFGLFGGVLSPALLIGACTGAIIYHSPIISEIENLNSILAVSGMAAVSSSVIGAPITAIILVFELTGSYDYSIASILPIALCNLITYLLFGSSFFDAQLKNRNIPMGYGRQHIMMSKKLISSYIDKNFLILNEKISIDDALDKFKSSKLTEAYFVGKDNQFLGKLKLVEILHKKNDRAIKSIEKKFIKLSPEDNILISINKLNHFVGESVPIIDKNNKILGIISENDVLKAYSEITEKIRKIEKN